LSSPWRRGPGAEAILEARKAIVLPISEAALFLDLDGTLAPLVARPQLVGPDPYRNQLLANVAHALEGRVAIVSGRSIEEVDRITGGCIACVAGLHGLERRDVRGSLDSALAHPQLEKAIAVVEAFAHARPGLLVEKKRLGVALHYRETPDAAAEALAFARRVAWATGLKLQEGQMVAELRCPGSDKGDMLRAFMQEWPFAEHFPIFVGDDITDEDGFVAAQELDGVGVLVGPRRHTNAACRLTDVRDVLLWLELSLGLGAFELTVDQ
jgi:trehalose 6-phosphate phosphatase